MWSRQPFLSSGNLFFFGAQLGLIGESVHACQIQNVAFWGGSFEKNRGLQELSQEEQKQLQQGGC